MTLYASAEVTKGNYSLTHTSMWANDTTGNLNSQAQTTVCLDWNAGEDEARVSVVAIIVYTYLYLLVACPSAPGCRSDCSIKEHDWMA